MESSPFPGGVDVGAEVWRVGSMRRFCRLSACDQSARYPLIVLANPNLRPDIIFGRSTFMSDEILPIPEFPEALREAAQLGKLIPFVGAGASRIAGCPGWNEFADALNAAPHVRAVLGYRASLIGKRRLFGNLLPE